jgi:hypothetical protein
MAMTPGDAIQADANREDGWPYPDDDGDLRAAAEDDVKEDTDDDWEAFGKYDADPFHFEHDPWWGDEDPRIER